MEQVSYNLRLDLKDTGIVNTGFRLKQGDSGMKISVSIFNRGVNVFDSTTVPKIVFKRPDGASVMANMTVGASVYEYVFVGNELQQPGVEIMDVKFTLPNDKRESTVSCSFVVVPDTITPNTHGSDIYDNDLAELVAEATAAAETVEEVVGDSEAWAVGERNGVPVGPEDPAYHNNSKWWSEQANVTSLAALTDVDLNNPADDDGLVYNSTEQKWKNKQITTKKQWKKNGAYNLYNHNLQTQVVSTGGGSVTVTVNRTVGSADYGTFSIVGTVGSATDIVVGALDSNVFKAGQKYKLTGCPSGGGASTYNIRITGAGVEDHGDGVEFTATGSDQMKIQLRGASINATFKPMITTDLNATYDDYVPHAKTNRQLTEDVIPKQVRHETLNNTNFGGDIYVHQVGRIVYVEGDIQIKTAIAYNTTVISSVPQALSTACGICAGGDGSYKGRLGISGTNLIASSNLTAGYVHIAMSYIAK